MMLSNENSENLIEIFKNSLDVGFEATDQISLLEAGTVEEVIIVMNNISLNYLKNHKAKQEEIEADMSEGSKTDNGVGKIPFTDCIQTHIDLVSGELNGFTMRP
jgi:hypothetical protein